MIETLVTANCRNTSVSPSANDPMILHVRVVCGEGGGPEKTILNSPRFLEPNGYRALCAYLHPPGDPGIDRLKKKADDLGAAFVAIPDRGPLDGRVVRRLLAICRERRVAIWHGHDYKSNAIGLALRRFWPMRLVTTVHGWGVVVGRTPLYYAIDRFCLRFYDRVVCVSEDLLATCVKSGVRQQRCTLIENAIDEQQYRRLIPVADAKRRLGLATDRLLVGAVGRLSQEKGFDCLITAVDQLNRQGTQLDLVIAGEGDERPRLESLIRGLGREQEIRLLGQQQSLLDWYSACDLFALSSIREGLPNVVLEAMAMEVPVVATNIAGVPRLIEHDVTGILVPPSDPVALASALRQLATNVDLRSRLIGAARRKIEQKFGFARRMEKMRKVYEEVLDGQ